VSHGVWYLPVGPDPPVPPFVSVVASDTASITRSASSVSRAWNTSSSTPPYRSHSTTFCRLGRNSNHQNRIPGTKNRQQNRYRQVSHASRVPACVATRPTPAACFHGIFACRIGANAIRRMRLRVARPRSSRNTFTVS
jgi:hypothetical protein